MCQLKLFLPIVEAKYTPLKPPLTRTKGRGRERVVQEGMGLEEWLDGAVRSECPSSPDGTRTYEESPELTATFDLQ